MTAFAVVAVCLVLWWYRRAKGGAAPPIGPRLAGYLLLVLAGLALLRGRLDLALLAGGAGAWLTGRLTGLEARIRAALAGPLVAFTAGPDGAPAGGRVRRGEGAGLALDALTPPALLGLLARCRREDAASARRLEAYLDRRLPGWRVDAQRDADPGPRRAPQPGAMPEQEAYQILGLERGAPPEEIRRAHRALMKRLHPDQGGTAERAARVNAARDSLLGRHR